jgi:hypothetical protein
LPHKQTTIAVPSLGRAVHFRAKVFSVHPNEPYTPYSIGDCWFDSNRLDLSRRSFNGKAPV